MKSLIVVFGLLAASKLYAYGNGYTSAPMISKKKLVSAELTGVTSTGGGVGVQARYTQKVNSDLTFDAGIGMAGGELNNRIFVGADYLIFPDYQNQPRVSLKATFNNAREFNDRRNIVGIAPNFSKGFSFWGHEAFPYVAVPVNLNLNSGNNTYQTAIAAQVGMIGKIPVQGYEHLSMAVEGTVKIKDHHSGIAISFAVPME